METSGKRRRVTIVTVFALGIVLTTAHTTARYGDLAITADGPAFRDPDHQRIMDWVESHVEIKNLIQESEISRIRNQQNTNTEAIRILNDRFWGILVAILLSLVASLWNVRKVKNTTEMTRDMHEAIKDLARALHQEWDGTERRRYHRRTKEPPESD